MDYIIFFFSISDAKEYCSADVFQVACKQNEVILMEKATYGRMRAGKCIGPISIGCNADILGRYA